MMQGDSYGIKIEILNSENSIITPDDVSDVEVTIGSVRKTYSSGEVTYNSDIGKWVFPLTQEETFKFPASRVKAQVRVVMKSGDIHGASIGEISVSESISKEVL